MKNILESGEGIENELEGIGEKIEVTSNRKKNIKRNARDRYESDQAGVRELINNCITGIYKASDNDYIDIDEGNIEVILEDNELTIEDNGIGMSSDNIRNVLSEMGVTDSRHKGNWIGYFGVGFFSVFRLSGGKDIAFETKSRKTGEEIRVETDLYNMEMMVFDEDDDYYGEIDKGTKIVIDLKDSITEEDISSWLEETFKKSRIEITYKNKNKDKIETIGGSIKKGVDNLEKTRNIYYNSELFEFVISDDIPEDEFYLLDTKIKQGTSIHYKKKISFFERDYSIRFRLKTETPIVISGKNKGKKVINSENYEILEDTDDYIRRSDLLNEDITTPKPTDTRDDFTKNNEFWEWLSFFISNQLIKNYKEEYQDIKELEDLCELPEEEINDILRIDSYKYFKVTHNNINKELSYYTKNLEYINNDPLIWEILSEINIEDRKIIEELTSKRMNIYEYIRTDNKVSISLSKLLAQYSNDVDVYVGASISESKREAVHKMDNTKLFSVPTELYDISERLGYTKTKDLNKQEIKNAGVSTDKTKKYDYTIYPYTRTKSEGSLKNMIEKEDSDFLIFHPDGINISQYKGIARANDNLYAFNCPTKTKKEMFIEYDNCYIVDDYIKSKEIKVFDFDFNTHNIEDVDCEVAVLISDLDKWDKEVLEKTVKSYYDKEDNIYLVSKSDRKWLRYKNNIGCISVSTKNLYSSSIKKEATEIHLNNKKEKIDDKDAEIIRDISDRYYEDKVDMIEVLSGEDINSILSGD